MPTLRSLIDGQIIASNTKKEPEPLKVNDQVVLQRTVNRGRQSIGEVMAGKIISLTEDGRAEVSLPRAGGRMLRTVVPLDKLKPASAVFGRREVHPNPAFRQIAKLR